MKQFKGVIAGRASYRVSVAWQGRMLRRQVNYKLNGGKHRALVLANTLARRFHRQLGKPLRTYVRTVAQSSTGHIGVHKCEKGWMLMVRGKGRKDVRKFIRTALGIRYAVAQRAILFKAFHRNDGAPERTPKKGRSTRKARR